VGIVAGHYRTPQFEYLVLDDGGQRVPVVRAHLGHQHVVATGGVQRLDSVDV